MSEKVLLTEEVEIFEPVLGEIVSDDSFSFTLLSCHCNKATITSV